MRAWVVSLGLAFAGCSPAPAAAPNPTPSASSAAPTASGSTAVAPMAPLTKEQKAERWLAALDGLAAAAKKEVCVRPDGPVASYRKEHYADLASDEATSAYVDETPALRDRARAAMDAYVTALTSPCH